VLRYQGSTSILPEYRATWSGHTYDIVSVVEVDTRHRELQLLCREVVEGSGFDGA
jgi:head-tail adaptor